MSARYFQYTRVPVMNDRTPTDGAVAEYLSSHHIEADMEGIWDRVDSEQFHYHGSTVRSGWDLRSWNVVTLYLDGVPLRHPNDVPADFPMREVLAALEAAETGEMLRERGPRD